jgi:phosphonate ABC transporter permease subunit PhnE
MGLPTHTQNLAQQSLFAIGFAALFLFLFNYLSFGRSLIDGTLPPQTQINLLGLRLTDYVFRAAIVGAVLGAIGGGMAGLHSAFPLGDVLYNIARVTLNIVRSIEPLIMGLVFVIWVGIGPFAGVLALTLHSIASLGKLYSEQIENIDPGPIEALRSTGANQLQTIIYAVVPQIVPAYIAFTMYRWDINVRMSTIIGFVGGGGIGLLLQQQINLLKYRDAGVAVLAIAVVVSILDYASAYIREKLT